MALTKLERRTRIKLRIRKKINGTAEAPRLAVFRSNKQIYVQVIDDLNRVTLLSASSKEKEVASQAGIKKIEQAKLVGKLIATKCKEKGIDRVIFDRSGYLYHGRVKSLADAAREGGLKF
ncbi:MAG TPA: 50S ribosomal protein L18 [Bacteroidales bacterium]|nr:50S ribosomal protein L18 [Bacteroidales bacterium]